MTFDIAGKGITSPLLLPKGQNWAWWVGRVGNKCILGIHSTPGPESSRLLEILCQEGGCSELAVFRPWMRQRSPGLTTGRQMLCSGDSSLWLQVGPAEV